MDPAGINEARRCLPFLIEQYFRRSSENKAVLTLRDRFARCTAVRTRNNYYQYTPQWPHALTGGAHGPEGAAFVLTGS